MLNKTNQLIKDKDFNNVFKKGRSSFNGATGMKTIGNQLEFSRFGILIGTKVSKKAVERNKIKRQVREIIRSQLSKIKAGQDCVIVTLPAIKKKKYQEIKQSIITHFKKLKLYKI